jgi:CHC2 zinc finger
VPPPASDDAFAEVKAKVDLVKVVQEHVRLTKRNKDFWGVCPFHQEDSPTSSQPPLQGRHPRANRRTLIDPIPTVLSQVTAACPVFIASETVRVRRNYYTTVPA